MADMHSLETFMTAIQFKREIIALSAKTDKSSEDLETLHWYSNRLAESGHTEKLAADDASLVAQLLEAKAQAATLAAKEEIPVIMPYGPNKSHERCEVSSPDRYKAMVPYGPPSAFGKPKKVITRPKENPPVADEEPVVEDKNKTPPPKKGT
eukprot:TRINITY_DN8879_c0_g2_i1.p3 TRINITY_DN8879_c0_g2~~TRINITY_DN8879_c0_g2_i1.p3  ORF type:complete len:152 (+),score=16.96 TRINITY_DN8879_c0_g2_i1:33-488(+)